MHSQFILHVRPGEYRAGWTFIRLLRGPALELPASHRITKSHVMVSIERIIEGNGGSDIALLEMPDVGKNAQGLDFLKQRGLRLNACPIADSFRQVECRILTQGRFRKGRSGPGRMLESPSARQPGQSQDRKSRGGDKAPTRREPDRNP